MIEIDGPRLAPRSGQADGLVVLLHGYGSNGDDLIGLAEVWQPAFPRLAWVAPHAGEELPYAEVAGYQWFPLTMRDPTEYWRGAQAAAPRLTSFLERELARTRVAPQRLALVGFSQGAMMAMHVGLRREIPPAAILAYSGLLAGPEHLAAQITSRPPVMLMHGELDDVIPVEALHRAREALAAAGVGVEWHVAPGLGHGIDEDGVRLGASALAMAFR